MNVLLCLVVVFLLFREAAASFDPNFEADLETWSRLKRRAGYYTESGRYKGGLYKRARSEELEWYECVADNGKYCTSWTAEESSKEDKESGSCTCDEGKRHYCASWSCNSTETKFDADCRDTGHHRVCVDKVQKERTICSCSLQSANRKYCRLWNCTETTLSDGAIEHETYNCTREHDSRKYCDRWIGDIVSKKALESSVCQCDTRGQKYCLRWTCKERELIICKEHGSGWCNFPLAVGVAGGFGTAFIFYGLFSALQKGEPIERAGTFVWTSTLCLPWTAGVVIWGGVLALPIAGGMWAIAFSISVIWLYRIRHDEWSDHDDKRNAPSSSGSSCSVQRPRRQWGGVEGGGDGGG